MCGIVGVVAKSNSGLFGPVDDIFEELLYADGLRGMDSTGVFSVDRKNKVDVLKQAVDPGIFLKTQSWKQFKHSISSKTRVVVGHNRKATSGEIISENAHPFVDKDIVLVHNGWIGNSKEIDSSVKVDSQSIITALDKAETVIKGIQELTGAYAIAWYNHKTRKFYLSRNDQRPLHVAHTPDLMLFASEGGMLEWILRRNGNKSGVMEIHHGTVWEMSLDPFEIVVKDVPKKQWSPLPTSSEYRDTSTMIHHSFPERDHVEGDPCAYPPDLSGNVVEPDAEFELEGDEHPLPELTRLKRQAEEEAKVQEKEGDIDATAMYKLYKPMTSMVLFAPTAMFPDDDRSTVFEGWIWQPGKPYKKAKVRLPEKDSDLGIMPAQPLVAVPSAIFRRGPNMWFQLDPSSIRKEREVYKDVHGNAVGYAEWQMICNNCACDKCAKAPKSHQIDFTAVVKLTNGYSITCADCVNEQTTPEAAGANGG